MVSSTQELVDIRYSREGMESPLSASNPWDTVYDQGNQELVFKGPSTLRGTPLDPYAKPFGKWMYALHIFAPC